MDEPKQFFHDVPQHSRTSTAVYEIKDSGYSVAFECVDGGGNVPRNATSFSAIREKFDLDRELAAVASVGKKLLDSLKVSGPSEISVEFGVEVGGAFGIPKITACEAKANFKVVLSWKNDEGK